MNFQKTKVAIGVSAVVGLAAVYKDSIPPFCEISEPEYRQLDKYLDDKPYMKEYVGSLFADSKISWWEWWAIGREEKRMNLETLRSRVRSNAAARR
jgi:hypothetical protein